MSLEMQVVQPRADELTRFKPGTSGNPKGRPKKGDALAEIIREMLQEFHPAELRRAEEKGVTPRKTERVILDRLLMNAMAGDIRSAETIFNRAYGKPLGRMEIDGQVDHDHQGRIEHEHTVVGESILARLEDLRKPVETVEAEVVSGSSGDDSRKNNNGDGGISNG